ncbi:MAG: DMT family transporter [Alphaproteobacteria bacterium]|nr:DMT family transporter [Alphaproteobacteria bacterium]
MSQPASADAPHALRGIGFMAATLLFYALIDAITKYLSAEYPVIFILWARYVFQTLFLAVLLVRAGSISFLRTQRLGLQSVRAGLNIATNFCFIFGLSFLPLADAVTLFMVGPLFVTALSVPLLGEKVGPRRWAAVGVGFVGALIIVRPGMGDSFQWASLLMILAALINALFQISTRKLSATEQPLTTQAYLTLTGLAVTSAFVPFFWVHAPIGVLALLAVQGVLGNASNLCLMVALRHTPASTLAPFNYGTVAFAAVFGYLIFDQFPDHWTVTGALVIIASGLYIIHRESVRRRALP